jgi:hypothetical protein
MDKLNILPPNDTRVFHSSIEGNNCLVRTGTINDKILSFFNSILLACSKNFKNMRLDERENLCKKVRDNIFVKITKNQWKINGINLFKTILESTLKDFYDFINTNKTINNISIKKIGKQLITSKKQFDLFKIITEILPYDIILTNNDSEDIEDFKTKVFVNLKKFLTTLEIFDDLSEEQTEHLIKNISDFIKLILNEVEYVSFKTYEYDIKDINDIVVDTVSSYFNTNIYFLNSKTRMPFILNDFNNFKHANSIIIINIDNKQYEVVGVLTHGNIINRNFISNDKLILKINSIINYDPSKRTEYIEEKEVVNEEKEVVDEEEKEVVDEKEKEVVDEEEKEEVKKEEVDTENNKEEEVKKEEEIDNIENNEEEVDTENNEEEKRKYTRESKSYRKYVDYSDSDSDDYSNITSDNE